MQRSWIWMAIFSLIFLALGGLELADGEPLAGAGYLVGGAGGGLVTAGQRLGESHTRHRTLAVAGSLGLAAGAALLGAHVLG